MQKRFGKVQREKGREIFEGGKFNLELFQYVIDEYYKNKQEQEDLKKQQEKEENETDEDAETQRNWMGSYFGSQATAKGKAVGWGSAVILMALFSFMIYKFFPFALVGFTI